MVFSVNHLPGNIGGHEGFDSFKADSQLTFTCSKSTIKTLEKGVKCVQS